MEELGKILSIAIGGAFGAVARYLINVSPLNAVFDKFPLPTFVINITGSFLIGFLMILFADKYSSNENLRMAIIVGFLGAFTTFSTFEMEMFGLFKERQLITAFLYLALSVIVGFLGVVAGVSLGRRVV
ncbi:MAG TPA: fluoride efflux transporter CrcB [Pyrinomonadaceae bacterium]|nr:fluoride efflux transporter CrcB [Acidobacteriota bacterium]HQZ97367.1 fluoride efflux transporter CrcB [Pyrinomonadaceae bacterium]